MSAAPTEDALRVVFAAIAHLPGSVPLAEADVAHLAALGGAVGRIVYFVDALEDLPRDQIQGGFNPCLADLPGHPGQTADPVRVEATCRALDTALDDAAARIDALPWARSRALLHNTLVDSQRRRGVRAKATARRHAGLLPPPAPAPGVFPELSEEACSEERAGGACTASSGAGDGLDSCGVSAIGV